MWIMTHVSIRKKKKKNFHHNFLLEGSVLGGIHPRTDQFLRGFIRSTEREKKKRIDLKGSSIKTIFDFLFVSINFC